MIGVFKQKSPGNIFLLFLVGLAIKIPLFLYPKNITASDKDGQLFHVLLSFLTPASGTNASLCSIISFSLLYIQALMLNYLLNEYRMTAKQTFLPALAYLLITSLLPEWNYFSSPLVASTLVIGMFILLFKLYNVHAAKGSVYNIGLIAGISSYIFFPSAFFIICIVLGIIILKSFRWNEIVLFIMGCLTPYYFYAVYLFLIGQFNLQKLVPYISISAPNIKSSIWLAASTFLLALPFLAGGYFVQAHLGKMLIQGRKTGAYYFFILCWVFFYHTLIIRNPYMHGF